MKMTAQTSPSSYLSKLKVLAISMVLVLHVAASVRDQMHQMAHLNWLIAALMDALARAGVPLFVMISGALLLGKEETIPVFYRKRFGRLWIPFLVWGLAYALYDQAQNAHTFQPWEAILTVLQRPAFYHLWYLYMLVGLYLITPFIRILMQHIHQGQLALLLKLWFVFSILLPHLYAQSLIWLDYPFHFGFGLNGVDLYLGYYLLGFYLHRYGLHGLRFSGHMTIFAIVSLLMVAASYALYIKGNAYNPLYLLNESPFVLVQAMVLFSAFKRKNEFSNDFMAHAIGQIATLSFGIYLVHPLIIDVLHRGYLGFELDAGEMDTILSIPITWMVVFVASFIFCFGLSKVPLVKRIVQ
jgi:surface polysaccharide O-acyltransferase-like enzyme